MPRTWVNGPVDFGLQTTKLTENFKGEVIADGSGKWCGNACVFATEPEADEYIRNLMFRWTAVRDVRTVPTNEPANYVCVNGRAVPIPVSESITEANASDFLGGSPMKRPNPADQCKDCTDKTTCEKCQKKIDGLMKKEERTFCYVLKEECDICGAPSSKGRCDGCISGKKLKEWGGGDEPDDDDEDDDGKEENPREKGDDDGVEYGDPRDARDERDRD